MNRRHFRNVRRYSIPALAVLLTGACLASLAPQVSLSANAPHPATACTNLASLTNFPVTSTRITRAQFNPPGIQFTTSVLKDIYHMLRDGTKFQTTSLWLPGHCQVQGIINERTGADGFQYGDMFEVRLPMPADWNGRFMFQGGGGTEGSLPPATGSAGPLSPTLAHGWARAARRRYRPADRGTTLQLSIDRDMAARHGIHPQLIDDTLYDAFGQRQVAQYYTQLNTYHVILEILPELQGNVGTLDKVYIRSPTTGDEVPLSVFCKWTTVPVRPLAIAHQGQFPL